MFKMTKWELFNSLANRKQITILPFNDGPHYGGINGVVTMIEAEDESGHSFNIRLVTGEILYVRTND